MAFLHEEEDDRYSSEPHLTGEFVIVEKFGGHALRHLASIGLWIWSGMEGGREGGRQTKNLVLVIFKKNPYLSFYNCCIVLCTISGFSNVKAV